MKSKQSIKLWGGAFSTLPDDRMIAFTAGRDVAGVPPADVALLSYDLWLNKAHTVMLAKTGCIPAADAVRILRSLSELESLIKRGMFVLDSAKEDVHTNIESWLTGKLGIGIAGKLHTARSRNDQIVTDMRLYLRDQLYALLQGSLALAESLLKLASTYKNLPMPGFTHHQPAMVTTFGHVLAGWAAMMVRDIERLEGWYRLHNHNPLGSVASFGTSYPIDRKMTSGFLAFDRPDHNSLDAITNHWEPEADLGFAVSVLMNHLSHIAETLIVLSMPQFSMVTLSDGWSTGSSIMPQKKNPDPLEVIKGKAAYAQGQLTSLLSIGKGSFIGYNRDTQWSKYIIMDQLRECRLAPTVITGVLETLIVHEGVFESWSHKHFLGATVLMEQLACQYNLSMREAKVIIEHAVKMSGKSDGITAEAIQHALAEAEVQVPITPERVAAMQFPFASIASYKSYGSPGKQSMKVSLRKFSKQLMGHKKWLAGKLREKKSAESQLLHAVESLLKGGE